MISENPKEPKPTLEAVLTWAASYIRHLMEEGCTVGKMTVERQAICGVSPGDKLATKRLGPVVTLSIEFHDPAVEGVKDGEWVAS
jgi:hypothetical protein